MPVRGSKDKMCLLVAMGIADEGQKCLPAIKEAASESTESWERVLRDRRLRGMNPTSLAITGGAGGLGEASSRAFPETRPAQRQILKSAASTN